MKIEGLTDFQNDLMSVERNAEKVFKTALTASGNKLTSRARKKARQLVKKGTGLYHKKFKRGKVFIGPDGAMTVRAINTAPHAHLIEYGHRQVTKDGREVGFTPGKKVIAKAAEEFEASRDDVKEIANALDKLLERNRL